MPSDVVCMALANAPSGEQMSRFLAVGLNDNTVRIISLDPSVSIDRSPFEKCEKSWKEMMSLCLVRC